MIKRFKDLRVYKDAYALAMKIFWETRKWPKEEVYSLTSQVVRSARSVSANIAEGWSKRHYDNVFKQFLVTSLGSNGETEGWLDYAKDCKYLSEERHAELISKNNSVGKQLTKLYQNWKNYGK